MRKAVFGKTGLILCGVAALAACIPVYADAAEAVRNQSGGRFHLEVGGQSNGYLQQPQGTQNSHAAGSLSGAGAGQASTAVSPPPIGPGVTPPPIPAPVKEKPAGTQ